ncbi:hypothetical protein ACH5RR_029319 [Cinchona calisaya]|uniref:Uncharacterized protein n=1 Tax=Cinchona calisaya TaxID=153742 RepID=A0ABD2YSI1_9GENT
MDSNQQFKSRTIETAHEEPVSIVVQPVQEEVRVVEPTPKVFVQGEDSPQDRDFKILNPMNRGNLLVSVKERDLIVSNSNSQQQNPSHMGLIAADTCIVDIAIIVAVREERTSHDTEEVKVDEGMICF